MDNPTPVKATSARIASFFLLVSLGTLAAQETPTVTVNPVRPVEAPAYLFETRLGDADVGFDLKGSWTATLSAAAGLLAGPGFTIGALDSLPDIAPGFSFAQAPDITASVTIQRKYFLEVAAGGNAALSSLLMGYRGDEGELVRRILIGTKDIEAAPLPFFRIPGQGTTSLGASALLSVGTSLQETLLRWDYQAAKKKVFQGKNELIEETDAPGSFIRGRFFFLPDTAVESLKVYREDASGSLAGSDGRNYREAAFSEVTLDAEGGLVTLKKAIAGRILVRYVKSGYEVGDPALGKSALPDASAGIRDLVKAPVDFSWNLGTYLGRSMAERRIRVAGIGDCLLLWEPGDSSPFQICGSYAVSAALPDGPGTVSYAFQALTAGAALPTGILFKPVATDGRIDLIAVPGSRRSFANAWPLPDSGGAIYGGTGQAAASVFDYRLVVDILSPVEDFVLESSLVPGSVTVLRNGLTETRFEVEAASGKLTFLTEIVPTDRIEVHYRTSASGVTGGDLLFSWSDTIPVSDLLRLTVGAGLRWNLSQSSYTESPFARTGSLVAGVHAGGGREGFSWSADAAAAVTNPDTTGMFRLFGMEGLSYLLNLDDQAAYPAAPPVNSGEAALSALNQGDRGFLFYRDYRVYDLLGASTLNPVGWADAFEVPYATGGWMGPYNVLGSSVAAGRDRSLVFDFSLASGKDWVGCQMPLPVGTDLSATEAVTVSYYGTATGSVRLYIQAGALGEDIDGSGLIAAESSSSGTGFPFTEMSNSVVLVVGGGPRGRGNGVLNSKDADGDGILDAEQPSGIVTLAGPSFAAGDTAAWNTASFALTDAQRALLASCRGVRLLLVRQGSGVIDGKIRIDSISFDGGGFAAKTEPAGSSGTIWIKEIGESFSAASSDRLQDLETAFPLVRTAFHPNAEPQEVLQLEWKDIGAGWKLRGGVSKGCDGASYNTLVFYLKAVSGAFPAGARFGISLVDAGGLGFRWEEEASKVAASAAWREVRISRVDGVAYLNGVASATAPSCDASAGTLTRLSVWVSGSDHGVLLLDEIHLSDPKMALGAAAAAKAGYRVPGAVVSIGDVPVLSNLDVEAESRFSTAGFASLSGIPATGMDFLSRLEAAGDLPWIRTGLSLLLRLTGTGWGLSGGHSLQANRLPIPMGFSDAFSLSPTGEFSRKDTVNAAVGGVLNAAAASQASSLAGVLTQTWTGNVGWTPLPLSGWNAAISLRQASEGWTSPADGYAARWLQGFSLLAPWTSGSAADRVGNVNTSFQLATMPVGAAFTAAMEVRSTEYSDAARSQNSKLDLNLSIPLTLPEVEFGGISAVFTYRRNLILTSLEAPGSPFLGESYGWWRTISAQTYLLSAIPFVEIFQNDSAAILPMWSRFPYGKLVPEARLSFKKGFGSRLLDLFVPSQADVAVGRDLEKESDLATSDLWIQAGITTKAINLFGALGSTPVFRFYRTDEIGVGVSSRWDGAGVESMNWKEAVADLYLSFLGFHGEALTVENKLRWNAQDNPFLADNGKVVYDWRQNPSGGVALPLIPDQVSTKGYFSHSETMKLLSRVEFTDIDFHPLTLTLIHATSVVYPDFGSIRLSLTMSGDLENRLAEGFLFRVGGSVSLEAKLSL